jgi:hypothetical protein
LSFPIITVVSQGWPALLQARQIESPESSSAPPSPEKEVARPERPEHGSDTSERTEIRSQREFHLPYNVLETEPADRRKEALGAESVGEHDGDVGKNAALGKGERRPELGGILRAEKSLAKNIDNMENLEKANDVRELISDITAARKAGWAEAEVAKLQKDTVEFVLKLMIGPELDARTEGMPPLMGYGGRKTGENLLAPGMETVNDAVTVVRHDAPAMRKGDFSDIRNRIERAELSLALHVWSQFSFLHPASKNADR